MIKQAYIEHLLINTIGNLDPVPAHYFEELVAIYESKGYALLKTSFDDKDIVERIVNQFIRKVKPCLSSQENSLENLPLIFNTFVKNIMQKLQLIKEIEKIDFIDLITEGS